MEIILKEKPKNPTIIEGFPGIGLIGTITTEYLIKHLKAKSIGYIKLKDAAPIAAIHDSRVIQPLEIFYVKSKNIVIIHSLIDAQGIEWKVSEALSELYKQLKAKEIISIEGILGKPVATKKDIDAYHFTLNTINHKKLKKAGSSELKEGILMGITAALLLHDKTLNTSGVFVETHSKLPDSRAAAKIIEVLDGYLGLKVDFVPLEKAAAEFEEKLKEYISQVQDTATESIKKNQSKKIDYMG
ncbi:MAG: PAC2 family protein [Nanoarchaeota archaeon]|nr:PAC2 family protein [Nanoarchaeota archaeon]